MSVTLVTAPPHGDCAKSVEPKQVRQQPAAGFPELLILDELQQSSSVSQRALVGRLGMAVSALNWHLHKMIKAGYIELSNRGVRPFAYEQLGRVPSYFLESRFGLVARRRGWEGGLSESWRRDER